MSSIKALLENIATDKTTDTLNEASSTFFVVNRLKGIIQSSTDSLKKVQTGNVNEADLKKIEELAAQAEELIYDIELII